MLVHGLLGYSFSWRHALPVLSEKATVYAVDMLGVGFSDRPPNLDCRFRAHAERLLAFLDGVGITSCDLLGTSHGGAVVMMAAALAPERVRRLILVAPVNDTIKEVIDGGARSTKDVEKKFNDKNEELFQSSYAAQFISGTIQPAFGAATNRSTCSSMFARVSERRSSMSSWPPRSSSSS